MPTWGNTDTNVSKPRFSDERQVRKTLTLYTANTTNAGNTVITLSYNDGAGNNVANLGVAVGQYLYFGTGLAGNGVPGFFASNNTVSGINGNNVTMAVAAFNTTSACTVIEFDTLLGYQTFPGNTYFKDTVLVSNTRIANVIFAGQSQYTSANLANSGGSVAHVGWNHVVTFTGGRAGRVQTECLVALANVTTANTLSGNTSNSLTYYAGL